MMLHKKSDSLVTVALLLAFTAASAPLSTLLISRQALAQAPATPTTFPLPTAIPSGTALRVDGSSSMTVINETLGRRFQERYPGTQVELAAQGTDQALQDVLAGRIDLVAVGRALTEAERAQGLAEVPISREKIAIIVGPNNPFNGSLTFDQFARIFRGEITNWSEVGGPDRPIRFIDRPETSDTRNAFRPYRVFEAQPFQTGATAVPVATDQTAAVIAELGEDGVSYAIASQVLNQPNVRVLPMHQTLPDDPRYPFSQPRGYVYANEPGPVVRAFLGFATSAPGQEAVEEARETETAAVAEGAAASPQAAATPTPIDSPVADPTPAAAPASDRTSVSPWWLLLPLALLGGLFALGKWKSGRPVDESLGVVAAPTTEPGAAERAGSIVTSDRAEMGSDRPTVTLPDEPVVPAAALATGAAALVGAVAMARSTPKSSIILAARDADDGYAYWETPNEHLDELRQQGGRDLKLRIYDVTDAAVTDSLPQTFQDYDVTEADSDRHIPLTPNRDYVAEVGYGAEGDRWLPLATSNRIRTPDLAPVVVPEPEPAPPAATVNEPLPEPVLPLVPPTPEPTPVAEVSPLQVDHPAAIAAEPVESEPIVDPGPVAAEPVESEPVAVEPVAAEPVAAEPVAVEPVAVEPVAAEPVAVEPVAVEPIATEEPAVEPDLTPVAAVAAMNAPTAVPPAPVPDSTVVLVRRADDLGYAYWDISEPHGETARQQGGQQLALRIFDVTGLNDAEILPQTFQQFNVDETAVDHHVPISRGDRDYLAEVGYLTESDRWLPLARSKPVYFPATENPPTMSSPDLGAAPGAAAMGLGLLGIAAIRPSEEMDDQSAVEATKYDVGQTDLSMEELATVDEGLPDLPDGYGESRIVLMPRDPQWAYTYWDVPNEHREDLRRQGGQRLALRLYDATDVDLNHQHAHSMQQYDCEELARDWYLPIPVSDRDYVVEIGYLTPDGRWLILARSAPAHIPPVFPSDWYEDQFLTLDWNEDLRGKTLLQLVPPSLRGASMGNAIFDQIFGMAQSNEALRVAGSLFGSMQMVPEQAISSYIFPSGVGMAMLPTMSMSGIGMSGIGMSGVGFFSSMPPIRPRNFWLVADAELIVYGATEPDATVTIDGRPIQLNPDGTFRFHMSFQDGNINFPIVAIAADGEQTRAIHMTFTRETPYRRTNTKEEAIDEWPLG